jgi:hypothetical protein
MRFDEMTGAMKMDAYKALTDEFGLKANQRDALDASPLYPALILAAFNADWSLCQDLLLIAKIT